MGDDQLCALRRLLHSGYLPLRAGGAVLASVAGGGDVPGGVPADGSDLPRGGFPAAARIDECVGRLAGRRRRPDAAEPLRPQPGRCEGGETIQAGYTLFPYWYCENYKKYMNNHDALPFDQHCLTALVAPRLLIIGAALDDVWADNDSQFLVAVASSPAWELYGVKGFISEDRLPLVKDNFTEGNVGFYLRAGAHFFSREDWNIYIKALKEHFNF